MQFATTPERRVVLMNVTNDRVCAEPSPDAGENLSYNLSAALSAKKTGAEADANFAQALQSAVQSLFTRTQGVQFYRDGMFSLCLAYMNGAVDQTHYAESSRDLREKAADLIRLEIPYIAGIVEQKKSDGVSNSAKSAANPPASPDPPKPPLPPGGPSTPAKPTAPAQPQQSP
ncbi:MAG: hypothetical protein JSR67_16805 [Proteobacteria bacterium]|nr:hypothetical protein [Pseudomonadota bacterium]